MLNLILILIGAAFFWVVLLYMSSYLLIFSKYNKSKLSPYECGFLMNKKPSGKFEVSFFVVAILFLIMDLEMVLLLPSVLGSLDLPLWGYIVLVFFVVLLGFGLVLEWLLSGMEW